jgi:hypothetical protein
MERRKFLYRCTAEYDGHTVTRHFQTRHAADEWARKRLTGYGEDYVFSGPEGPAVREAIPPALRATVEQSHPVQWPERW